MVGKEAILTQPFEPRPFCESCHPPTLRFQPSQTDNAAIQTHHTREHLRAQMAALKANMIVISVRYCSSAGRM